MKIAVINEFSTKQTNKDIIKALQGINGEICNVGMTGTQGEPDLNYVHAGFMAGAMLNSGAADFVIGGCGTGQGFSIAAMQYPQVFCGMILQPLDAWLFSQINAGNCISLVLNYGYGWAADVNLALIFEKLFQDEAGAGYPKDRRQGQQERRDDLSAISALAHQPFIEILQNMDADFLAPILAHKPFCDAMVGAPNKEIARCFKINCNKNNNFINTEV